MNDVIRSDIHFQEHTGELTHKRTQPTENIILERNKELRRNPGVIQDLGAQSEGGAYGRQVASVPFIMYEEAIRDGYELNKGDSKHRSNEMMRFLRSEKGQLCLIQGKV
ncbi:MAG: hypothetical protein DRP85_03330 [Candidatus Makaraimicrobium thalassicum]|nr:MAG: hypothetical protein DRP85_03330 [Candidatus Omnitrophota bacterium]